MTALAPSVSFDPTRDKAYQQTRLGSAVVDFLAWKETGGAAAATLDQYERDLARACLMYPDTGLEEFGDAEMLQVAKSFTPKSRRVRVAAYKSFFKWAVKVTRQISLDPTDALPAIKREPQKFIDIFSDEEIAVLEALPLRDGALMQLLFDSGLRKGEARRFRFAHFHPDPAPGRIVVLAGKGGKDRVIPATLAVSQRLNELAVIEGLEPEDHLWYGIRSNGRQSKTVRDHTIGEGTFAHWWRRCLDQAGVRYRNPHVARHTFATRWLRSGARLTTLSDAMGHTSFAITSDFYGHLDQRDVDADMALVEAYVNQVGAEG